MIIIDGTRLISTDGKTATEVQLNDAQLQVLNDWISGTADTVIRTHGATTVQLAGGPRVANIRYDFRRSAINCVLLNSGLPILHPKPATDSKEQSVIDLLRRNCPKQLKVTHIVTYTVLNDLEDDHLVYELTFEFPNRCLITASFIKDEHYV